MRVYCCHKHRDEWYMRTIPWSHFRDAFLGKHGKKCDKCGLTPENIKSRYKISYQDWINYFKSKPEFMEEVKKEQIEKLKYIEEQYEQAMDIDHLIENTFRFDSRNRSDIPEMPRDLGQYHNYSSDYDVDHILAIVNGGEQWDEKNLQILCKDCHKVKTKEDMKFSRKKK